MTAEVINDYGFSINDQVRYIGTTTTLQDEMGMERGVDSDFIMNNIGKVIDIGHDGVGTCCLIEYDYYINGAKAEWYVYAEHLLKIKTKRQLNILAGDL